MGIKVKKLALHALDLSRVYPTDDVNFSLPFGCHLLKDYMNYDENDERMFVNDGRSVDMTEFSDN